MAQPKLRVPLNTLDVVEDVPLTDLEPVEAMPVEEPPPPAGPEGSAIGRFASGVWENVNPVNIATGLYQAVRHPIDTGTALIGAQLDQAGQAYDAYKRVVTRPASLSTAANVIEAQGHALAAAVPLLGPMAAKAGERMASGDIAGGLGEGVGLIAPMGIKPAVRGVRAAAQSTIPAETAARWAGTLEGKAQGKLVEVMAPKVGANKGRFGDMAAEVAPRLAREPGMGAASVETFRAKVGQRLSGAEQLLDDAADARLAALTFDRAPIVEALKAQRATLTSEAVKASPYPRSGSTMIPKAIGKDVVPAPNAARVAQIDQALAELDQLGPTVTYDAIRNMRMSYDIPAKQIYNPSTTADFLKHQGGARGAADVTGVLRDHLGKWDPGTAVANAEYSFWRTADDVMAALEHTERTRPKVGRTIMARLTGAVVGGQVGGAAGAVTGGVLAPILEAAVGAGPTAQIEMARAMTRLATALRKGDTGAATAAAFNLKQFAKRITKEVGVKGARATHQASERQQAAGSDPQLATP